MNQDRPGEDGVDHGIELLTRVSALFRIGRTYSTGNQLFAQQLDALVAISLEVLRERGEYLFVCHGGEVFLDGRRIATSAHGYRMAKALREAFAERGIAGFEVRGEPAPEEWRGFFELIMDKALAAGPDWAAAAAERGLERITPVRRVLEEPGAEEEGPADASKEAAARDALAHEVEAAARSARDLGALGGMVSPQAVAALGAGPKHFQAALDGLTSLVTSTSAQHGIELRHARRVVQPVVDAACSRDPVVLGLAGLVKRDEYSYSRVVNACMIATAIGQRLGFERGELATLSVAALLHGVGRAETDDPVRIGPRGALLIARRSTLQELTLRVMRVALEAGGGPPPLGHSSVLSQIVGIAAMYARVVSARGGVGKGTTPAQALGMIVGPLTGGFDPALKVALVETLGFHPPGQLVQLDDNSIAMVIAPDRTNLDRPIIQPILGPDGRRLETPAERAGGALPPERSILRDLNAGDMPDRLQQAA